jgi:hypothetical protein
MSQHSLSNNYCHFGYQRRWYMNEHLIIGQTTDVPRMPWFTNAFVNCKIGLAWSLQRFIQECGNHTQYNFNFWVNKRIPIKTHMLKHSLLQQDGIRSTDITKLELKNNRI